MPETVVPETEDFVRGLFFNRCGQQPACFAVQRMQGLGTRRHRKRQIKHAEFTDPLAQVARRDVANAGVVLFKLAEE